MIHLDTHVALWLHPEEATRLPARARRLVDTEPLLVSPLVELEPALLHDIGRVRPTPARVLEQLERVLGVATSGVPFRAVVQAAAGLAWTRDPFDQLIRGAALADEARLLTADRLIRANLSSAVWD